MRISREIEINAAHRLMHHAGQCSNIHGHRYRIIATVEGEQGDNGMVADFADLKDAMLRCIDDPCDHATIACTSDEVMNTVSAALTISTDHEQKFYWVQFETTVENLAEHWFALLCYQVVGLVELTVYETPTCSATYRRA